MRQARKGITMAKRKLHWYAVYVEHFDHSGTPEYYVEAVQAHSRREALSFFVKHEVQDIEEINSEDDIIECW